MCSRLRLSCSTHCWYISFPSGVAAVILSNFSFSCEVSDVKSCKVMRRKQFTYVRIACKFRQFFENVGARVRCNVEVVWQRRSVRARAWERMLLGRILCSIPESMQKKTIRWLTCEITLTNRLPSMLTRETTVSKSTDSKSPKRFTSAVSLTG